MTHGVVTGLLNCMWTSRALHSDSSMQKMTGYCKLVAASLWQDSDH